MCDGQVRILKPHELTETQFISIQRLISDGGEVATAGLPERLRALQRIALRTCKGKLACIGAIKPLNPAYVRDIARKSAYPLESEICHGEFGYFVTLKAFRGQGLAGEVSSALVRHFEGKLYATTREDNVAIHKIVRKSGFEQVGQNWRSEQHPGSMLILWLKK